MKNQHNSRHLTQCRDLLNQRANFPIPLQWFAVAGSSIIHFTLHAKCFCDIKPVARVVRVLLLEAVRELAVVAAAAARGAVVAVVWVARPGARRQSRGSVAAAVSRGLFFFKI